MQRCYNRISDSFSYVATHCNFCIGLNSLVLDSVTEGDLRLIGSTSNGVGAVEIYTQLGWTTICPDSEWSNSDANAVCQRLGYDSGTSET